MSVRTIRYGDHPEQFAELHEPAAAADRVVLIHGGCFRARYTLDLERPVATALASCGFAVLNVEYRRLDAGGTWPEPLADVVAAIECASFAGAALIGHSAGGYLALLGAARVAARLVVAQAPVVDLEAAAASGVCAGAAERLLAAGAPPAWAEAPGCPVLLVHGDADGHVPIAQSESFLARAGGSLRRVPGADHMVHLDPASEAVTIARRAVRGDPAT